jgi:transcriptional regulator with GAF, ATPase, and Fis domain
METTDPRLRAALETVSQFLVADVPLGRTLDRIAVLARDAIATTAAVGITLADEQGRPATRVFTDDISPDVDQGQYDDDQGPCLDALREGRVVRVPDTGAVEDRWPSYSRRAVAAGVVSTLSLPLKAGDEGLGVMNLYSTADAYDEPDERDAALFARQAAVVLANCRAYWNAFDLSQGLQEALASRATIDMAKGKIMAANGCTPDEAFQLLVKASQRENVRLRDVARRIVEGTPGQG